MKYIMFKRKLFKDYIPTTSNLLCSFSLNHIIVVMMKGKSLYINPNKIRSLFPSNLAALHFLKITFPKSFSDLASFCMIQL